MITERDIARRRWLFRLFIVLALLPAIIWGTVPKEPVETDMTFDPSASSDLVATFLARDADSDDITPGAERAILWAGEEGASTDLAILYVHGFSATAAELRPVPDRIGEALDANVIFVRLPGHGMDGDAMAGPTVADWIAELDEALAVAAEVADRVVIMGTSTGGTLATLALAEGREADGLILVSPNFRVANPAAMALTLPGARYWMPRLFGHQRTWEPKSEAQARYWTSSYPTLALFPMAALVEATAKADLGEITTPTLFYFSDTDTVVDHRKTREMSARWGGPVTLMAVELGEGDDPDSHVIAGDIMSPGRTDATVDDMVGWLRALD